MAESEYLSHSTTNDKRYQRILLAGVESRDISRQSSAHYKATLVGSIGSGINVEGSDMDIMFEQPDFVIDESLLEYRDDLPCYVRIPTRGLPASTPVILLDGGEYLRADRLCKHFDIIFNMSTHGTGESKVGKTSGLGTQDSNDFVPQITIDGIPRTARSFTTRTRSWPCDDIVALVSNGEFHLVARPAPCNPDISRDFCLSFSKAEVVLNRSMSAKQVKCIAYLKFLKHYIDGGRGVLTSYHLKTISLWYWENANIDTWANDWSVTGILEKLDQCLKTGFLPHYFVSEMNLFNGISGSDMSDISRCLQSFLGCSIVINDVAGLSSYTRLLLTRVMIDLIHKRSFGSRQFVLRANDSNICQQLAEKLYLNVNPKQDSDLYADDVAIVTLKRELSKCIIRLNPTDVIKEIYVDYIEIERSQLNGIAHKWLLTHHIPDNTTFEWIPNCIHAFVYSLDEPLYRVLRIDSKETYIDMPLSQQRNRLMETWMAFTDGIITRATSHKNNIVDELLSEMSRESTVIDRSTDECKSDIDRLLSYFDRMTSELLSSTVRDIDYSFLAIDSFSQPLSADATENIMVLLDAMEKLFVPVEYAIVSNSRLQAVGASCAQSARLRRVLNPKSLEYKCIVAWQISMAAILDLEQLHVLLHALRGWLEFTTTAIGSPTTYTSS